jgi:hypothetical protein
MGQAVLYAIPTGGSPQYNIIVQPWTGAPPQGQTPISYEQGKQYLQDAVNSLQSNSHNINASAFKSQQTYWNSLLSDFTNKTGQYSFQIDPYLSTNFKPDAATPNIANYTDAGKAAYISPEQGLADSQKKAVANGGLTQAQLDAQNKANQAAGGVAPGQTPLPSTPSAPTGTTTTTAPPPGADPNAAALSALLSNPSLSADQKAAIQHIYETVSANDTAQANRLIAGFNAATQYSDPFFKAQIRLATDALTNAFQATDGDLAFKETSLRNTLADLEKNTAASKNSLSLDEQQQLNGLKKQLETELQGTQDKLAATGFTTSSVRSRSEQLLKDTYGDMTQSTTRAFGDKTRSLDSNLASGQRDTAAQIEYYKQLAAQGKLDALRKTEEQVGSSNLAALGYNGLLGGVGGTIPQKQITDALAFAGSSGFVF